MPMKEVELYRIVHSDSTPECHMYLREKPAAGAAGAAARGRVFPVIIAMNEMAEIHRKVHGVVTRRPMTHDLFGSLMKAAGLQLLSVEITELKDDVFYARMNFRDASGREFAVDARPSDSVAIATGLGATLYADEKILDAIGIVEEDDAGGGAEKEAGGSN
jgi:bifunctional DNase/RNase